MTSRSDTPGGHGHDAAVALAVVLGEAAVVWLWVAAIAAASPEHGFGLPLVAVAAPAIVAAGVGWRWSRWRPLPRATALVGIGLLGALMTASLLTVIGGVGSSPAELAPPWDVTRPDARFAAGLGWAVALFAWARGLWVGARPPTARSVARAALIGGLALGVGVLNVGPLAVGAMLLLFFLCATTALALVRQRDLERDALGRPASRPGAVWLSVLVVPLAAVAVAALVVGLVGTVVAGPVSDAVGAVLRAARSAGSALVDQFGRLAPGDDAAPPPGEPPPSSADRPASVLLPGAIITVLLGGAVAFGTWRFVRAVRQLPLLEGVAGRGRDATPEAASLEEESTTLLSWRHLLDQLRSWLARLARRRPLAATAVAPAPPRPSRPADPVRGPYYDVLVAARAAGAGRAPTETSDELAARLAPRLGPQAGPALGRLSELYATVRYGEGTVDDPGEAATSAERVTDALAAEAARVEEGERTGQALADDGSVRGARRAQLGRGRSWRPSSRK
ncbi:MAG: DUF4129 domain-containing protein [Acidimicrobiia bacterium]|nr:DUF4129 domain-containing protein [Acidimicrobiia bacterium]